jgi:hypothetical protein
MDKMSDSFAKLLSGSPKVILICVVLAVFLSMCGG